MKYRNPYLIRLIRRIKKKILIKVMGYCYVNGHSWKMQKGWQSNPDFDFNAHYISQQNPITLPWIYYRCRRCNSIGEKIKD